MTKRQKLIKAIIDRKRKFIVENFGKLDSVRMEKEEKQLEALIEKLPKDCIQRYRSPYAPLI